MDLQERMQQIALIKETIKQKISQNYLMQFIDEPYIDEDRMNILIESLSSLKLTKGNINKYVTTTMLIQIALDTHDKVNNTSELLKKRQLTVLAGDYYSGLYYKILAEVENVPLIRTLAEGIKIVNEHKVAIYRLEDCTVEQYMDTFKKG
nr:heptaprenyl diphosphate synthase component 1 [Heyndrickxia oleronia]